MKFAVLYYDLSQVTAAQCVLLLENVRFHKGETKNDPAFAEQVRKPSGSNVRAMLHYICLQVPCGRKLLQHSSPGF